MIIVLSKIRARAFSKFFGNIFVAVNFLWMVDVRAGLGVNLAVIQEAKGKTRPYEDDESTENLQVDIFGNIFGKS